MTPDCFPWQVGLPLAALLWAFLIADACARRSKRERRRVDTCTESAKAGGREVRQGAEGRVAAVVVGSPRRVGAGDGGRDPRVAGRRWSVVAAGLVVALAGLTACSAIDSGTVTGKRSQPGYFYMTTSCHTYGKTTTCTQSPVWMPPTWTLDLREGEKTGWASVSESTYAEYEVGEVYP